MATDNPTTGPDRRRETLWRRMWPDVPDEVLARAVAAVDRALRGRRWRRGS